MLLQALSWRAKTTLLSTQLKHLPAPARPFRHNLVKVLVATVHRPFDQDAIALWQDLHEEIIAGTLLCVKISSRVFVHNTRLPKAQLDKLGHGATAKQGRMLQNHVFHNSPCSFG